MTFGHPLAGSLVLDRASSRQHARSASPCRAPAGFVAVFNSKGVRAEELQKGTRADDADVFVRADRQEMRIARVLSEAIVGAGMIPPTQLCPL
jgi:hypothetical protein